MNYIVLSASGIYKQNLLSIVCLKGSFISKNYEFEAYKPAVQIVKRL